MRKYYILFLFVVACLDSTAQRKGDYYVSIPIDSSVDCKLTFLSDSTVELSNVHRHMSALFRMVFTYKGTDTTIEILQPVPGKKNVSFDPSRFNYPIRPGVMLTKIDGGFLDRSRSLIYVREKNYSRNRRIAYVVNGKMYVEKMGITNGTGIVRRAPRTISKALQKSVQTLTAENATVEMLKGIDAYERFGIRWVYGVIVINRKS
jgi:hypothetical protein